MLASASDRMIVIYTVQDANIWTTLTEMRSVERIYLRPGLEEIYDLEWSPDSCFIIVGAINNKVTRKQRSCHNQLGFKCRWMLAMINDDVIRFAPPF
jgi:hypothetical protein